MSNARHTADVRRWPSPQSEVATVPKAPNTCLLHKSCCLPSVKKCCLVKMLTFSRYLGQPSTFSCFPPGYWPSTGSSRLNQTPSTLLGTWASTDACWEWLSSLVPSTWLPLQSTEAEPGQVGAGPWYSSLVNKWVLLIAFFMRRALIYQNVVKSWKSSGQAIFLACLGVYWRKVLLCCLKFVSKFSLDCLK